MNREEKKATTHSVQHRKRAAAGVVNNKPIGVRLKPDELQRVKQIAELEHRTMAAVCRLAILRGLTEYEHAGLIN